MMNEIDALRSLARNLMDGAPPDVSSSDLSARVLADIYRTADARVADARRTWAAAAVFCVIVSTGAVATVLPSWSTLQHPLAEFGELVAME